MPFDPATALLDLGMQIPKEILGFSELAQANKGINELNKSPYDFSTISPELQNAYGRAEAQTKFGYSPEETAQFQQQLAREQSGTQRQATDMSGGQMGSAIAGVLQANNTDAINKFAGQGAELEQQHIQYADELASKMQSQSNLIVQQKERRREMLEQAYGAAKKQGLENVYGGFNSAAALVGRSMTGIGGGGAGATDSTTTPIPQEVISSGEYEGQPQSTDPTTAWNNRERVVAADNSDVAYDNQPAELRSNITY